MTSGGEGVGQTVEIGDLVYNGRIVGRVVGYWPEHGTMRVECQTKKGPRQTTGLIGMWKPASGDYNETDDEFRARRRAIKAMRQR